MTTMAISEQKINGQDGWEFAVNKSECDDGLLKAVEGALLDGFPGDWEKIDSAKHSIVLKFEHKGRVYIFKEFAVRGVLDALKAKVKGSRASRAWNGSLMIEKCGLKAPRLIMRGDKKKGRDKGRNFIVTCHVPQACGIFTFLFKKIQELPQTSRARVRSNIAAAFGEEVGRLHACGVAHGDLRLENIMVTKWNAPKPEFYFIDNERNVKYEKVPRAAIVKNLVAVNMVKGLAQKDRLLFFNRYLERMSGLKSVKKELMEDVWRIADERVRKAHGVSIS